MEIGLTETNRMSFHFCVIVINCISQCQNLIAETIESRQMLKRAIGLTPI